MAHPVRPEAYVEMDNFYTATVYEKGAEVVRMYDALLAIQGEMGADNFEIAYSDGLFVVEDAAAAVRDYASQGYDLVIDYSTSDRTSYKLIRENRPDPAKVLEALDGFITNSRFENGIPNTGYIEALGLIAPPVGK